MTVNTVAPAKLSCLLLWVEKEKNEYIPLHAPRSFPEQLRNIRNWVQGQDERLKTKLNRLQYRWAVLAY